MQMPLQSRFRTEQPFEARNRLDCLAPVARVGFNSLVGIIFEHLTVSRFPLKILEELGQAQSELSGLKQILSFFVAQKLCITAKPRTFAQTQLQLAPSLGLKKIPCGR